MHKRISRLGHASSITCPATLLDVVMSTITATVTASVGVLVRRSISLFILCSAFVINCHAAPATGKSFFMPRSISNQAFLTNTHSTQLFGEHDEKNSLSIAVTPFYQESTNRKDLARYFFPGNKTDLTVKDSFLTGPADLWSEWFEVAGTTDDASGQETTFSSKIRIRPEHKEFGTTVHLKQHLDFITKNLWFSILFPFVQIEHNLNFIEYDLKNNASIHDDIFSPLNERITSQINMTTALNNPVWLYGKFKDGIQKLTGLADITTRLGYVFFNKNNHLCNIYFSTIFPTSHKPTAEFVFEPIIGTAGHFGVGFGINFSSKFFQNDQCSLNLNSSLDYNYLFSATERRSFDLIAKGQWSRYTTITLSDRSQIQNTFGEPGINEYTRLMKISPQSMIQGICDLTYEANRFSCTLGYNFYARQEEQAKLKQLFSPNILTFPEMFSIGSNASELNGYSALNYTQNLSESDIDFSSATHPAILTHSLYGSFNYFASFHKNPLILGIGSFIEFSSNNKSLNEWGIFSKIQLTI